MGLFFGSRREPNDFIPEDLRGGRALLSGPEQAALRDHNVRKGDIYKKRGSEKFWRVSDIQGGPKDVVLVTLTPLEGGEKAIVDTADTLFTDGLFTKIAAS